MLNGVWKELHQDIYGKKPSKALLKKSFADRALELNIPIENLPDLLHDFSGTFEDWCGNGIPLKYRTIYKSNPVRNLYDSESSNPSSANFDYTPEQFNIFHIHNNFNNFKSTLKACFSLREKLFSLKSQWDDQIEQIEFIEQNIKAEILLDQAIEGRLRSINNRVKLKKSNDFIVAIEPDKAEPFEYVEIDGEKKLIEIVNRIKAREKVKSKLDRTIKLSTTKNSHLNYEQQYYQLDWRLAKSIAEIAYLKNMLVKGIELIYNEKVNIDSIYSDEDIISSPIEVLYAWMLEIDNTLRNIAKRTHSKTVFISLKGSAEGEQSLHITEDQVWSDRSDNGFLQLEKIALNLNYKLFSNINETQKILLKGVSAIPFVTSPEFNTRGETGRVITFKFSPPKQKTVTNKLITIKDFSFQNLTKPEDQIFQMSGMFAFYGENYIHNIDPCRTEWELEISSEYVKIVGQDQSVKIKDILLCLHVEIVHLGDS